MKEARLTSFWHRAGPLTAVGLVIAAATAAQGCGGGTTSTSTTSSTSGDTTGATTGSGMGGGTTATTGVTTGATTGDTTGATTGSGGAGGGMHTPQPPVAAADIHTPFDATPDSAGKTVYITANGDNGPGVYSAPADGSNVVPVAVYPTMANDPNSPFIAPLGIAMATNDKTLYVADAAAGTTNHGAIYAVPVGGGLPTIVMGTDGAAPHSLEVVAENGIDVIYFTGVQLKPGSALPGVFKVPAGGGASATAVSVNPSYQDLSGIHVAANGDVYFVDTTGGDSRAAQVDKLAAGVPTPTVVVTNVNVGYPAGIALTMDGKTALLSALDSPTLTDRLLSIDLTTNTGTALFPMELGGFVESAGLHRAKGQDVFAYVDSKAGPKVGRVFTVTFK